MAEAKQYITHAQIGGNVMISEDVVSTIVESTLTEVDGVVKGGMIPKVDCCVEAVRKGVERATILDGRVKHSILIELLSKVVVGTMFQ